MGSLLTQKFMNVLIELNSPSAWNAADEILPLIAIDKAS